MITWDEAKRESNRRKHGLDFAGCEAVFDGPVVTREDDRQAYGEQRFNLLGILDGQIVHMTFTEQSDDLRVISLRQATKHEARYFISEIQP